MEHFIPLLLEVWREACRHILLSESIARILPVLVRRLPLDLLLVRHIDPHQGFIETLAASDRSGVSLPTRHRTPCPPAVLPGLLEWCRSRTLIRADVPQLASQFPGLLPEGSSGAVLAGGLAGEEGPRGVLVLLARQAGAFTPEHEPMLEALLEPLAVAVRNDRQVHELNTLKEAAEADRRSLLSRLGRQDIADTIIGVQGGLREVMERVDLVAPSDAPVLILGETGTGKEVVARAIHTRSRRAAGPFLRVNCGAIPPELVDSELFGHERGSFTGATERRQGWFERADGGTLFLDEAGELTLAAQVRLLRILQDGSFQRVGGQRQLSVDVRVVTATHQDLRSMVPKGLFRQDLWYRIAVFPIRLPALRERPEDIPSLATHFALQAARRLGLPPQVPTPEDLTPLLAYPWPGNVRELAAVMERAAILGEGRTLEVAKALGVEAPPVPEVSPPPIKAPAHGGSDPTMATLNEMLVRHIEAALTKTEGRIEGPHGAARLLDINPHTLRARMRKLGIQWRRFRAPAPPHKT